MQQAAKLQFERIVGEYVRWRAISEEQRSPAPAWWWGPAFEMLGEKQPMPVEWCSTLGLANGAAFSDGAGVFLEQLSGQTSLPWAGDFPRRAVPSDAT
jgi:hypothetical protein